MGKTKMKRQHTVFISSCSNTNPRATLYHFEITCQWSSKFPSLQYCLDKRMYQYIQTFDMSSTNFSLSGGVLGFWEFSFQATILHFRPI